MSDIEKVEALFTELGIGYTKDRDGLCLTCMDGHKKVDGCGGFYTDFVFEDGGKFDFMGAFE